MDEDSLMPFSDLSPEFTLSNCRHVVKEFGDSASLLNCQMRCDSKPRRSRRSSSIARYGCLESSFISGAEYLGSRTLLYPRCRGRLRQLDQTSICNSSKWTELRCIIKEAGKVKSYEAKCRNGYSN